MGSRCFYQLLYSRIGNGTQTKIGVCGDWLIGPKAEDAWSSARDLFNKIKKKPS